MSHTPGPWTIHDDPPHTIGGEYDAGGYRIDAHNIEQLAYVWRDTKRWGDNPTPFGAKEAEANARLIRAAPDLLAALKWFVDDLTAPHSKMIDFDANLARARAAIARAEGAAP